jgi:hypothetical protein
VSENRAVRKISGSIRQEITEGWRKLQNEKLYNFTLQQMLFGRSNQGRRDGQSMQHA